MNDRGTFHVKPLLILKEKDIFPNLELKEPTVWKKRDAVKLILLDKDQKLRS